MGWIRYAAAIALLSAFAGCGGGGGGGGFPVMPLPSLTTTVLVNGNAASAGSNGQFTAKPGDVITVTPSQSSEWTTNAVPWGSITLRNSDISATKWSAQLVNTTIAPSVFTVSARATADGTLTKDTLIAVSSGDARNLSYKVFSTYGSRQALALNFDTMSYAMTDAAGVVASDAFMVDPDEAGSYLFKSARNAAKANNARFRLSTDAVVGSFPFEVPKLRGTYAVQPFIASRALVTAQASLDGLYTRLGVNLEGLLLASQVNQIQLTASGTALLACNDAAVTAVASCPAASLLTYTVTPGAAPDSWNIANVAIPSDRGAFSLARVGSKNVYLSSGPLAGVPNNAVLQIGLEESAIWPVTIARGADTSGSWGTLAFDSTNYATTITRGDGSVSSFSAALSKPSSTMNNLRSFSNNGAGYFAAQDGTLSVVVGAPGSATAGYLQVGLTK